MQLPTVNLITTYLKRMVNAARRESRMEKMKHQPVAFQNARLRTTLDHSSRSEERGYDIPYICQFNKVLLMDCSGWPADRGVTR